MGTTKKFMTLFMTVLIIVGQTIGSITVLGDVLFSNDVEKGLYFTNEGLVIDELELKKGEKKSISFIDTKSYEEQISIFLPKNVEYISDNSNDAKVDYNSEKHILSVTYSEEDDKLVSFVLEGKEETVGELYAEVGTGENIQTSDIVKVNVVAEEDEKAMIDMLSSDTEKTGIETTSSTTGIMNNSDKIAQNDFVAPVAGQTGTGDFSVVPPESNIKIADQFVNNTAGGSNSYISEDYPQAAALTPKNSWQFGSIWSNYQLDLRKPFDYKSFVYLGERTGSDFSDTTAADGITFTLHNDERGQSAFGTQAGGLGAYGSGGSVENEQDFNYIKNALSIELDTWYNNSDRKNDQFDYDIPKEAQNVGHVGVVRPGPGELGESKIGHLQSTYDINSPLADNTWKQFDISWKPIIENGVLKADLTYSVGSLTQTYRVEDVVKMFNGTKTYFGFTSSTGSNKIFQGVSINSLPQKGFVYTYYKDIDTLDEIVPEVEFSGPIGTKWSSEKKDFSEMNYEFVKIEGNSDVVLTQDTQYITYWYKKLLPKVSLSKKVDKTTAKVGDTLTYTIEATNSGKAPWTGTILDTLDTNYVSLVADSTTVSGKKVSDKEVWDKGSLKVTETLKPGATVTISFQVKTLQAASGESIVNVAESDDPDVPPTPEVVTDLPKIPVNSTVIPPNKPKNNLPKTGEIEQKYLVIIGLYLLLSTVGVLIYSKNKYFEGK